MNWSNIKKELGIENLNKKILKKLRKKYDELNFCNPKDTQGNINKLRAYLISLTFDSGFVGAGVTESFVNPEAYRSVSYDDLPYDVKEQLKRDGTRGDRRTEQEARELYENDIPDEAKGSVDGVESITNNPEIEWSHTVAHSNGGTNTYENGGYAHSENNPKGGSEATRTRTPDEVKSDWQDMQEVAEQNTPGVSGDVGEVVGDVAECGVYGAGLGAGLGAVNRVIQAKAYRDAGREDLAQLAEEQIQKDAIKGAKKGLQAGLSVSAVQSILGANPLTAGIGIVAGDSIKYMANKESMTDEEKDKAVTEIVAKGAFATALACAGPIGWIGLAGYGMYNSYQSAQQKSSEV